MPIIFAKVPVNVSKHQKILSLLSFMTNPHILKSWNQQKFDVFALKMTEILHIKKDYYFYNTDRVA